MLSTFLQPQKSKSSTTYNLSRTFKKGAVDVYPILQTEIMKKINAVGIHYSCIKFLNFNNSSIKNRKNRKC